MERVKGFFFSLDALTALMVLIATVGFLSANVPQPEQKKKPFQLDYLDAALLQNVSDWNSSKKSSKTVLNHIYSQYYLGNTSEAVSTCENYFDFSQQYALYFSNSTSRDKACGSLSVEFDRDLATNQVIVPDQKINNTFIGPRSAVMVMEY